MFFAQAVVFVIVVSSSLLFVHVLWHDVLWLILLPFPALSGCIPSFIPPHCVMLLTLLPFRFICCLSSLFLRAFSAHLLHWYVLLSKSAHTYLLSLLFATFPLLSLVLVLNLFCFSPPPHLLFPSLSLLPFPSLLPLVDCLLCCF